MRHLEKELIRPVEVEFDPKEFDLLMTVVHTACLHYRGMLSGKVLISCPQVIERRLEEAVNLYTRLAYIKDANGVYKEEFNG